MGGFGSYFTNQAQNAQAGMPQNMQAQDQQQAVPPGTGGIKAASPMQNQQYAPQQQQYAPWAPFGGSGFSGYGGQPWGGTPGYGGMYGGGGYGMGGFPMGGMYGPGSYSPYGAGMMGFGGGSGMHGGPFQRQAMMASGLPYTGGGGKGGGQAGPGRYDPMARPTADLNRRLASVKRREAAIREADRKKSWMQRQNERSCFVAGTAVRMADGHDRAIENIEIGDQVLGMDGEVNTVLKFDRPVLGKRKLYSLNGGKPFVSAEHPFMTSEGWKSIDPDATALETDMECDVLAPGDQLVRLDTKVLLALEKLDEHDADKETQLYNFALSGNNTYYADGYLVHNKGPGGAG